MEEQTWPPTIVSKFPPKCGHWPKRASSRRSRPSTASSRAAHNAVSAFEGQAETARKGAKDVTEKAMTFRPAEHRQLVRACPPIGAGQGRAGGAEAAGGLHHARRCRCSPSRPRNSARARARWPRTPRCRSVDAYWRTGVSSLQPTLDCASQYFYCIAPKTVLYCILLDGCVAFRRQDCRRPVFIKRGSAAGADSVRCRI